MSALFDSGATISLLDRSVAQKLDGLRIVPTNFQTCSCKWWYIPLSGATVISVSTHDVEESILVQIQENCATDLVLRANFLARFPSITINLEQSYIQ